MYLDYFSLARHPFRITPDTSLFFSGGNQGRGVVLDAMLFAIESGEGILKVVGEVGSGKTMLCRMLEERLPETTEIVYLANPRLSPDEILYAIAFELKLPVRRDTSKLLVMQQLQNYLIKQHTANRKVLVIIEEAQGMAVETLEEIRLFSNLETQVDKLMQIILFGQPELDRNLSSKHIRQLRERITHSFHLNPLTTNEVSEYVRFRLGVAGCPCPQLLTRRAEWLLAKVSGGLTRRINILVDKALLAAFADNVLDGMNFNAGTSPCITGRHIWAAVCDSDYLTAALRSLFTPLRIVSASMLAVFLAVAFAIWPSANSLASQSLEMNQPSSLLREKAATNIAVSARDYVELSPQEKKPKPSPVQREQEVSPLEVLVNTNNAIPQFSGDAEQVRQDQTPIEPEESTAKLLAPTEIGLGKSPAQNKLQSRVFASIEWLRNSGSSGYTVQFVSGETSNMEFAESFLELLDENGLIEDSFVCMSNIAGQSYWTIKYGNFDGLSIAQNFIDTLPATIYEYKPFVQNMSSVECNTNNSIAALIPE